MINLDKENGIAEKKQDLKSKRMFKSAEIDISQANKVILPQLRFENPPDPLAEITQDWNKYDSITEKAFSYYNRKWYVKTKEAWLSIHDWHHRDHKYYTHLLRTYRKLIDIAIKKKSYKDALNNLQELFEKCPYYTNSDIDKYNKIITQLNKKTNTLMIAKELIVNDEPDCTIESEKMELLNEINKPKGFSFKQSSGTSILDLKGKSDFIPKSMPHIVFDSEIIKYVAQPQIPIIMNDTYRFCESSNHKAFLSSSRDLQLYLYNWDLHLLGEFDCSQYSEEHTYLRRISLSSDLSLFIFTVVDKAYFLDSNMNLISVWQVPCKDGFEKRKVSGTSGVDTQIKEYLDLLGLPNQPLLEEIKAAFRREVFKWHPDRNPNNPQSEEQTKKLIRAYEYLSGEDARKAFDGIGKNEYRWVDLNSVYKYEFGGSTLEVNITMGSGEDWIYGSGVSDDASRIYLGCYSGKIYQINQSGFAEKIYIIQEDKKSDYGVTNPISFVNEYNNRKYILTYWCLYILKDDETINYFKNEKGNYKWFSYGFIHQQEKRITLYDIDGNCQGSVLFKSPIKHLCFYDNILLVETTTKSFTFKLNY